MMVAHLAVEFRTKLFFVVLSYDDKKSSSGVARKCQSSFPK